ncbi:MAG: NADH-quinone oxidoreductase subunit NuoN, partial [Pseudomonadota bacterium]
MQTALNLQPAIAEIFVLAMVCVSLLAFLFAPRNKSNVAYFCVQLTLIIAFCISLYQYALPKQTAFYGMYIHDQVASLMKCMIYIISFFSFLYAKDYINDRKISGGDYYVLGLLSVLGMMVLVSANDLLILFLGLEILSIPLYAMVALQRNNSICSEAAMKYYITGALATGLLLYGLSILYGATNSIDIPKIMSVASQTPASQQLILYFALVFVLAGIMFKVGAAPFHMWAPDVYQGAPSSVTLFIGGAPKIAALGLIFRLLVDAMPSLSFEWGQLLIIVAVLSIGIGNVVAIIQSNLKRMLAYSSIAHMGYMTLGLIAATPQGYSSALFYIFIYAIMSIAAFAVIILLSRSGFEAENIADLKGLNSRSPWLAFMMLIIMFSMAGIPPTAGFFAKLG